MANPYGMTEFSVPALIGLNEQIKGNRLEQLYRQKQMDFQDRQMAQQEKQWQLEERKRGLLSRIYGGGETAQTEPTAQPQQPSPGVVSSPTPPAPGGDMGHYIAPDAAATMRKSLGAGYDTWKRKNNIYEDGDVPASGGLSYQRASVTPEDRTTWDRRQDGSTKGSGFLGVVKRPDGGVSSEISVGMNINGKEMDVPAMVPGLNQSELDYLLNNKVDDPNFLRNMPRSILQKAQEHAMARLAAGKPVFAQENESSSATPATPSARDMSQPPAAPVRNDGIQINQQALNELFAVDPETAFQVQKFAAGAQKEKLAAMQAHGEVLAQAGMYLKGFPPGPQRQAEFQRIVPELVARGLTQDELTRADLSDNGIQRYMVFGQGLKDLVTQQQKDREFGLSQERVNIARGALDLARGREGRMSSSKGGDVSGASTGDLLRAAGF